MSCICTPLIRDSKKYKKQKKNSLQWSINKNINSTLKQLQNGFIKKFKMEKLDLLPQIKTVQKSLKASIILRTRKCLLINYLP